MEVETEPFEINGVFLAVWIIFFVLAGAIFYFAERSFARYAEQHYPELYANLASTKQAVPRFRKKIFELVLKLYRAVVSSYKSSEIARHIVQNVIPATLFLILVSYILFFVSRWLLNLS